MHMVLFGGVQRKREKRVSLSHMNFVQLVISGNSVILYEHTFCLLIAVNNSALLKMVFL